MVTWPSITVCTCYAHKHNQPAMGQLNRVVVHGVLHLLGYKDKDPKDKALMTKMEDKYLQQNYRMLLMN